MIGSKVTAIVLEGWILPVGGVASGRCSLISTTNSGTKGGHPVYIYKYCLLLLFLYRVTT